MIRETFSDFVFSCFIFTLESKSSNFGVGEYLYLCEVGNPHCTAQYIYSLGFVGTCKCICLTFLVTN